MIDDLRKSDWFVLLSIAIVLLVFIITLLSGCAAPQKTPLEDKLPTLVEKVFETNWLATMFIVGVAISIFMLVRGMATGFPLLCASIGGLVFLRLDQSLAEKVWPYFVAGLLLLAGFIWYVIVTFVHKRAFKEVVRGGENYKGLKGEIAGTSLASFNRCQKYSQSISTEKLVKQVKQKLKGDKNGCRN